MLNKELLHLRLVLSYTLQAILTPIIVVLALVVVYIALQKIPLTLVKPYHDFPFLEDPVISPSPSWFLFIHTLVACFQVLITAADALYTWLSPQSPAAVTVRLIRLWVHPVFCALILTNFWHLGDFPIAVAVTINLLGVGLTTLTRHMPHVYFFPLATPAYRELTALVVQYAACLYQNLPVFSVSPVMSYVSYAAGNHSCNFLELRY